MRALRDRLRGHARAVLDTSLLHIQADLYLVDDRHEDGQHAGVSRRGMPPPLVLLGARIKQAKTACNDERARLLTW